MTSKPNRKISVKDGAYPAPPPPPKASRDSSTTQKPRNSKRHSK